MVPGSARWRERTRRRRAVPGSERCERSQARTDATRSRSSPGRARHLSAQFPGTSWVCGSDYLEGGDHAVVRVRVGGRAVLTLGEAADGQRADHEVLARRQVDERRRMRVRAVGERDREWARLLEKLVDRQRGEV